MLHRAEQQVSDLVRHGATEQLDPIDA